jgi:adenosylcobyric acid synthase
VIVLEGAGSPAEVNLRAWDMVNMSMAHHAQASVQIVGDIDRGGVYAHFVGTHACLEPADQALIHGFLVNRFRGDASLLDSAHTFVQQRTQVPIRGVIPWIQDLGLPDEDSVSLRASRGAKPPPPEFLDLVLLDLPCLSNQSDFNILAAEPGVCVRVVREVSELGQPDAVLIPGSKSVLQDLASLRQRGLDQAILQLQHTQIVGICGGLQMLGTRIVDGVENTGESTGLGLLDLHTVFAPTKTVRLNQAWHQDSASEVHGYEIHHGQSTGNSPVWLRDHQDQALGFGDITGSVWGTYLHGIWDNNLFRHHWLEHLRRRRGLPSCSPTLIRSLDQALDDLADTVRNSVDWQAICQSAQI